MRDEGDSTRLVIKAPDALARFIAPKGSVALNGTSLTVNDVEKQTFGINLVLHTKTVTTWGDERVGDAITSGPNARYVAFGRLSGLSVHKPLDQLFH